MMVSVCSWCRLQISWVCGTDLRPSTACGQGQTPEFPSHSRASEKKYVSFDQPNSAKQKPASPPTYRKPITTAQFASGHHRSVQTSISADEYLSLILLSHLHQKENHTSTLQDHSSHQQAPNIQGLVAARQII
mmetsp:Transcript_29601/g.55492  ORF Transcript_29601/g.55492 Transcript_29601/m.55492 type:complete len:133 (-) Transcript_29601:271-669(-)